MPARIAVVHYSSTGHVHQLARAVAAGAEEAGAEVRLLRVPELAPEEAVRANPAWAAHRDAVRDLPEAGPDDLRWANGYAFGTPTRYGLPAAQLKQFVDQLASLWHAGELKDKAATSFTSSQNAHGGQEMTLVTLNTIFYHWGSLIVPPDTTEAVVVEAGGNPYGTSYPSGDGSAEVPEPYLTAARMQGARLARFARLLAAEELAGARG